MDKTVQKGETAALPRDSCEDVFLTSLFQVNQAKTTLKYQTDFHAKASPLLPKKEPCEHPMKERKKWEGVVGGV